MRRLTDIKHGSLILKISVLMSLILLYGCANAPPLCPPPPKAEPPADLMQPPRKTTRKEMREIVTSVPRSWTSRHDARPT